MPHNNKAAAMVALLLTATGPMIARTLAREYRSVVSLETDLVSGFHHKNQVGPANVFNAYAQRDTWAVSWQKVGPCRGSCARFVLRRDGAIDHNYK
ncbi:hypothetical protein GCM10010971_14500 [Silvimonas amylolytica]|uniref:Uncharacterized protein n=1 Tax=Silvimonas amylolytica TaxID=449663 RepID=A0ABQ2PJU4_9NEIS|nr:hypothetical protein GCM10010971_14500 [Silvimonas amylolytica]